MTTTTISCTPSPVADSKSMYTPSISDIFAVRRHLLNFVPAEIAIMIIEEAQYWPKSATREAFTGPASVPGIRRDGEWCYVLSPPLPYYPGATLKPREAKLTLDCAAGVTYDSICSSSTTFNAAIVKDLTQNILYEATPERHINDWTISDPTRWLVQEVPLAWPVGSRRELVWKDQDADVEKDTEAVAGVPDSSSALMDSDNTSTSTPTDNTDESDMNTAPSPSLLDKLNCGERVAAMVQGMIPGWLSYVTAEAFYFI